MWALDLPGDGQAIKRHVSFLVGRIHRIIFFAYLRLKPHG